MHHQQEVILKNEDNKKNLFLNYFFKKIGGLFPNYEKHYLSCYMVSNACSIMTAEQTQATEVEWH